MTALSEAAIVGIAIGGVLLARALWSMRARVLVRDFLYVDLTVEEARRMIAEWDARTDAERAAAPEEERARIEEIRMDLADKFGEMVLQVERPAENIVLEVESDDEGCLLVTLDEAADVVAVPPRCAACLDDPTQRVPVDGVEWPLFPYCDACADRYCAVELRLSETGTLRLAFASPEYGWQFAAMNGYPETPETDPGV